MSRLLRSIRIRAVSIVLVAMALALAAPLGAIAEPTPFVNLGVSLLVQSQGGQPLLLVSGVLPDTVALPAEIALPVPEGSQIEWAGEIVGETVEDDIRQEAVLEERDGITVAVFTLTASRVAQVEVTYPGAVQPGQDGVAEASFALATPVPAESVRLAIALPPGGAPATIPEGALSSPGPDGYTYYYTEATGLSAGDPLELSLGYTVSAAAQPATSAAPASEVPPLLIVLIAAVIGGSVLMMLASRARTASAAAQLEYEETLDESEEHQGAHAFSAELTDPDAAPGPVASGPVIEQPVARPAGILSPRVLIIIAAVLVLGIVLAVNLAGGSSQVGVTEISDGRITQRISSADAVQQVDYSIRISCACPPAEEAPKIFSALATIPGVATASLEEATLVLRIGYDPALTDEVAIANALRSAGYLP